MPRIGLWVGVAYLAAAGAAAAVLVAAARLGDYPTDAGAAVGALARGSLRSAAETPFLMGPLSIVLRAPFVWLEHVFGGASTLTEYRAGVAACLVGPGALGWALARRWAHAATSAVILPACLLLSPVAVDAVQAGHPEELLGGALCVAAVLLADRRQTTWSGVALGLAVATKQWALIAIVPTLLAAEPHRRIRIAVVGAVTSLAVYAPFVLLGPHAFVAATKMEAQVESAATPQTIWFLFSHKAQVRVAGSPTLTYHAIPHWLPPLSHAAIVLVALPLALVFRRRSGLGSALALLALVFLLRAVLDPVDQNYFHAPFFIALLSLEVIVAGRFRRVPVLTLAALGGYWLAFHGLYNSRLGPGATNAAYLVWSAALVALLLRVPLIRGRPSVTLPARTQGRSNGWLLQTRRWPQRTPQVTRD